MILLLNLVNSNIITTVEPKGIVQFGNLSFYAHYASTISSPQSNLIMNGIPYSDLKYGLHVSNYRNYIQVFNTVESSQKNKTIDVAYLERGSLRKKCLHPNLAEKKRNKRYFR